MEKQLYLPKGFQFCSAIVYSFALRAFSLCLYYFWSQAVAVKIGLPVTILSIYDPAFPSC